jgi:hypothetical protein
VVRKLSSPAIEVLIGEATHPCQSLLTIAMTATTRQVATAKPGWPCAGPTGEARHVRIGCFQQRDQAGRRWRPRPARIPGSCCVIISAVKRPPTRLAVTTKPDPARVPAKGNAKYEELDQSVRPSTSISIRPLSVGGQSVRVTYQGGGTFFSTGAGVQDTGPQSTL